MRSYNETDLHNLRHIPEHERTFGVCMDAVRQNAWNLLFVPRPLRCWAICATAVERDGRVLQLIPEEQRVPLLCLLAVISGPYAFKYVPDALKTKELYRLVGCRVGTEARTVPHGCEWQKELNDEEVMNIHAFEGKAPRKTLENTAPHARQSGESDDLPSALTAPGM